LALAEGTYEARRVTGVTLVGACAARVDLSVDALGGDAALEELTLRANEATPRVEAGATVRLRGIRVLGAASGLTIGAGADVSAEAFASAGGGPGVLVGEAAAFECARCVFDGPGWPNATQRQGVEAEGARVTLREVTVRGMERAVAARRGSALEVLDLRAVGCDRAVDVSASEARVERVAADNGIVGLLARDSATLEVTDASFRANLRQDISVSRGTLVASKVSSDGSQPGDTSGRVALSLGRVESRGTLERAVLIEPGQLAVQVVGEATVEDLRVYGGRGGAATVGGRLTIEGGLITGTELAVSTVPTGPTLDAIGGDDEESRAGETVLRRVQLGPGAPSAGQLWIGAFVDFLHRRVPPRTVLEDVHIALGEAPAVGVAVLRGELDVRRLSVRGRGEQPLRTGIAVADGEAVVRGAVFDVPRAMTAARGARLELTDVRVDNRGWHIDAFGITEGSTVDARRLALRGDGGPGLVVEGAGSRATVRGLRAQGTGNLAALAGARLELVDAALEAPVGAGVALVGADTSLEVAGLWIRGGVPVFLGPRFAGVAVSADARASLADVTVQGMAGGAGIFGLLARLELTRVAITGSGPDACGLRLDSTHARGRDVLLRGIDGPGLVVIEADADLARVAVLDNRVGLLRQGESRLAMEPGRVRGNEVEDEVCDQCGEAPPEVAPPAPLPPL